MAVLVGNQVANLATDGNETVCCFVALRNVSTGDTLDVNGMSMLQNVHRAVFLGTTTNVTGNLAVSGSVVTIPAGLSDDDGYALLWGSGGV